MFIYRFVRRICYSSRAKTHIGQNIAENCFIQTSLFLRECLNKSVKYNFFEYCIVNFDQIFIMIINKSIIIRSSVSEK